MQDLGSGVAHDINNRSLVVGTHGGHAFIWESGEWSTSTHFSPAGSGWTPTSAYAINDIGQIVGEGMFIDGGQMFPVAAFLLTPIGLPSQEPPEPPSGVPEPGMLVNPGLLGLGVILAMRRSRRDPSVPAEIGAR